MRSSRCSCRYSADNNGSGLPCPIHGYTWDGLNEEGAERRRRLRAKVDLAARYLDGAYGSDQLARKAAEELVHKLEAMP